MNELQWDSFEHLKRFSACMHCQYYTDGKCFNRSECIWKTIEAHIKVIDILKSKTEIIAYHSRHSESGYELRIGSMDDDCFFLNLTEDEYNAFMEVLQ